MLRNLNTYLRQRRKAARQRRKAAKVNYASAQRFALLEPVNIACRPPIRDVVSISVMRNEMLRLSDFLRHYRKLGVARFVIVDNASTDGTAEYLSAQPDVDLWRTTEPYSSRSRVLWVNALAHRMGVGRWCLIVDADEQLVYDGCGDHDLNDLTNFLDRNNLSSLPCLMLDMYGEGPMKRAVANPSDRLIDICPYFDRQGYVFTVPDPKTAPNIRKIQKVGGPRHRLLSTPSEPFLCRLHKVPLAKWHEHTATNTSHDMYPSEYNLVRMNGCLLHFKFLADFHSRVIDAVHREQYAAQSKEYKSYHKMLEANPDITMLFSGSERYLGPESLVTAGLMTRLWTIEPMTVRRSHRSPASSPRAN